MMSNHCGLWPILTYPSKCIPLLFPSSYTLGSVVTRVRKSAGSETSASWPTLTQGRPQLQKGCFITLDTQEPSGVCNNYFLPMDQLLVPTCLLYFCSCSQMWTMGIQSQILWLRRGSVASQYSRQRSHSTGKVIE